MILTENDIRKIGEKVKQALNERVSNIVYHFCGPASCLGICEDNAFVLSSILRGTADGDVNKGRYYLSTTRQKSRKLGYSQSKNVRITLDGDALNQRYSGGPVDYWGITMGKQFYMQQGVETGHYNPNQSRTEAEDRIFSNDPVIPNADKYIKRIDICIQKDRNGEYNQYGLGCIQQILRTDFRDLVFVYDNEMDFERQSENTVNKQILSTNIVPTYDVLNSPAWIEHSTRNKLKDLLNIMVSYEYDRQEIPGVCAKLLKKYGLEKYIDIVSSISQMRWNIDDMLANTQNLIDGLRSDNKDVYIKSMRMLNDWLNERKLFGLRDIKLYKVQVANRQYNDYPHWDYEKKIEVLALVELGIEPDDRYVTNRAIVILHPDKTSIWKIIPDERRYFVDDVLNDDPQHNSKSYEYFKKYLLHFVRQEVSVTEFMDMLGKLQVSDEKKQEILGYKHFINIKLDVHNYDYARYVSDEERREVEAALQVNGLNEDYLYHRGKNVDVNNPDPYHSENRWHKWEGAGHETGSFGSGMYFTDEWPRDDRFSKETKDDIFNAKYDPRYEGEKFVRIADGLYRVDTDFYKNLYILHSEGEGNILEELMEKINNFVRFMKYEGGGSASNNMKIRQRIWLVINRNCQLLGLRLPWDYRGFCEFARNYIADETIKQTPATIFMELNGFNGVDASRAGRYNTYHQGSVIYDLSKVEKHMVPVQGQRDNFKLAHRDLFRTMTDDILSNKPNPTFYRSERLSEPDNPNEILRALKRYDKVLDFDRYRSLPEECKGEYLKILYRNIKSGFIDLKPDTFNYYFNKKDNMKELKNYLDEFIKRGAVEFMNVCQPVTEMFMREFSWGFEKKERVMMFLNAYRGNLEDFGELYQDIKNEYQI